MMKKSIIIPSVLFAAVFCVTLICQRYTLMSRENIGLFLLTPDWLREVFTHPWALSNFTGAFLMQFYAEPIAGPMIPAAVITVIYLCLNAFLCRCRLPFHRLFAVAMALAAWCLTASISKPSALAAVMLISIGLALLSWIVALCLKRGGDASSSVKWWQIAAAVALIAAASVFTGCRKDIRKNEAMSKVLVKAGRSDWNAVLKTATPDNITDQPVMMPFALLALNGQVKLGESMFHYPVTGVESLDLSNERNAVGNLFQAYLFNILGVPNEAIHQMFQFSTNFDHGMTHLSLRSLIRYNIDLGRFDLAAKYAEILSSNLYYRPQALKIIKKYGGLEPLTDSAEVHSSVAKALTQDSAYDMLQLFKGGNTSPAVMDRLLAILLLERNTEDFLAIFYSYDWKGRKIPVHYQEALLVSGDIRDGIVIDPELSRKYKAFTNAISTMDINTAEALAKGSYWDYYYRQAAGTDGNDTL